MARFFIEYEFRSELGQHYWFPLTIEAETIDVARDIAIRHRTALAERYDVCYTSEPQVLVRDINSERIAQYRRERLRGRMVRLNVRSWTIHDLDAGPDVSFQEHLDLVVQSPGGMRSSTIASSQTLQFPVGLVVEGPDVVGGEFLLINVVEPSCSDKDS